MSYTPKVNADTLTVYLGVCATGRASMGSTTLDHVAFGTVFNPFPGITFTPDDVGMPITVSGAGPVDPAMPPTNFIQGALLVTTVAAYVSPTEVVLADAAATDIENIGFANITLYRPCIFAYDAAEGAPLAFQFNSSIAPGTQDTLQFSVFNSFPGKPNEYIDRFGTIRLGQPVYLTSSDPDIGDQFGGMIDTVTPTSYGSVSGVYCWAVQCVSWAALARRRVVPPAIPQVISDSADVAFKTIVFDYLSNDGVSVIATAAPDIDIPCPVGANIGQLLDQCASLASDDTTAWYWTVDVWRNFILTTRTANPAPWNITDGEDLFAGDAPNQQSIAESHNQLANMAYAVGSQVLLNTLNVSLIGNGTSTTFNLPQDVGNPPTITLNAGSQTVGILGVDTGKDWYWSQGSAVITQDTGGVVLTATDTLLVSYSPLVQAVAQSPNVASLQALQAVEGTSAQYEHVSTVSSPILPANLLAMCEAYQLEYGEPATTATLYTLRPGLATGQIQSIEVDDAGIPSGDYLIATLQMTTVDNVIIWQYTAFGGANIGDALTPLVQFINRQQGTLTIITPTVPITASAPTTTLVQAIGKGTDGTNQVTFVGDVTAGNLLIAIATTNNSPGMADPPTTSDSLGGTWQQAGTQASGTGFPNNNVLSIMWAIAPASGPCTITLDGYGDIIIAEYSGIDATSPIDVTVSLGNSITVPALVTTKNQDLIVVGMSGNILAQTVTSPEVILGYSYSFSHSAGLNASWEVQSAAGSFSSTMTNDPAGRPFGCSWVVVGFSHKTGTAPPSQTTNVTGNPIGTVTNSVGALTSGEPVIGHGGSDVTVGTKTGVTAEFVTASAVGTTGEPVLWGSTGDVEAGTVGQLVPPGGSTGEVLTKNSGTDGDTKWAAGGGGSSPLTTKGDVFGFDTADARIPVGADGDVLTADSTDPLGVAWHPGGGAGSGVLHSGTVDPGVPSVTVRQSAKSSENVDTVAFSSDVVAGNTLVVAWGIGNAFTPTSISDTAGNTWTSVVQTSQSNQAGIYVAVANASGPCTVSMTFTGGGAEQLQIMELTGDVTATVDSTSQGSTQVPLVLTVAYDFIVSTTFYSSISACTVTSPEAIEQQNAFSDRSMATSFGLIPAPGSFASTLTAPGGSPGYAAVAFKSNPPSSVGVDGDWYLNLTTGVLWGPKAGGLWSPSGWRYVNGSGEIGAGVTVYSGLAGISLSGATIYFPIGGGASASATETDVDALMEADGILADLGASISAALGTTIAANNSVTLTLRVNGVDTAMTCTITNPATSASDTTHSVAYSAGDLLSVKAVFVGTITVTPTFVFTMTGGPGGLAVTTKGDLQGFSTVPARVAVGTDGDVLTADSGAATGVSWQPGGGGGGGTLPTTGWSAVNGILYNDFLTPATLGFFIIDASGLNWRFVQQSLSGGIPYEWIVTLKVSAQAIPVNAQTYGVYLTDGTKLIGLEILSLAGTTVAGLRLERMNSVTSDNTTVTGGTTVVTAGLVSLKITNDGTHRTFFYYASGAWVQFYQEASGSFLTETAIGVGGISVVGNATIYSVTGEILAWSLT